MIRASLVLVSLSIAASAWAAPPLLTTAGADQAVDLPAQIGELYRQHHASIAYGQNVYLAVWLDELENDHASVHAARIRASDGVSLDAPPIELVRSGSNSLGPPSVAFDGSVFVVIWRSLTTVRGVFVLPSGALSTKTVASPTSPSVDAPVVAAGGGQAMIAYSTQGSGIAVQLIDQNGAIGGPATLPSQGSAEYPAIAYSPQGYLVAWNNPVAANNGIFAALVKPAATPTVVPTGKLSDPASTAVSQVAVAFDATASKFLVAWQAKKSGPLEIDGHDVPAAVPDGGVTTPEIQIATTGALNKFRPQLTAIGGKFFAFWEEFAQVGDPSALMGIRVGIDASPAAASDIAAAREPRLPTITRAAAVASDGTNGRLIWSYPWNGISLDDVYTVPVPGNAAVSPQVSSLPTQGPSPQRAVAVGSNGSVFLVVWEDARNSKLGVDVGSDLYAQLYDARGQAIAKPFVLIDEMSDQRYPAVAGLPDGDFLVVWGDGRDGAFVAPADSYNWLGPTPSQEARLWYTRVSPAGVIKDPSGKPFSGGPPIRSDRFPTVAADPVNQRWLVAWDNDPSDPRNTNVFLSVVDSNGSLVLGGDGAQIRGLPVQTNDSRCSPSAAWTGDRFFVATQRNCFLYVVNAGSTTDVTGQFVAPDGTPDPTVIPIGTKASLFEMGPSVAWLPGSTGLVVWEEHASLSDRPVQPAILNAAVLDQAGAVAPVTLFKPAQQTPTLHWPRLLTTGQGYLLAFTDLSADPAVIRGLRIDANGKANLADVAGSLDPLSAVRLSAGAAAREQPNFAPSSFVERDRNAPAIASGAAGQVLLAYTAEQPPPVGRTHVRLVRGRSEGDQCLLSAVGTLGCAEGLCERDADANPAGSNGVCCSTSCNGPCQKCILGGCFGTPKSDPLCGRVDCTSLNTTCRQFDPAPPRCLGFGECGSSTDLQSCSLSHAVNQGQSCVAPGCSQAGACSDGDCVCPDLARDVGKARALPGCSVADRATSPTGGALLVLGLFVLCVRRRRFWAVLALLAGCSSDAGVLAIDLHLDDSTLTETARVRVVIHKEDAPGTFSPAPVSMGAGNETIRNLDLDGDGRIEIVADLEPAFPYKRGTTYLKVVPSSPMPVQVLVTAQAINRYGNPIAESAATAGVLPGGSLRIALSCGNACSGASKLPLTAPLTIDENQNPVTALAASASEALAAVGVGGGSDPTAPNRGKVLLYRPDQSLNQLGAPVAITGEAAGDRFGSTLLVTDLDRDGAADLVVGAPGFRGSAGRVYILFGALGASVPLGGPKAVTVDGAPGELLGSSLALSDLGGKPALVLGAPGLDASPGLDRSAGAVYLLPAPAQGAATTTTTSASLAKVVGSKPGEHLGRALAARGALVAAGSPGTSTVYLYDPNLDFQVSGGHATRVWTSAAGGGLGSALAIVDTNATSMLTVAAASPGLGQVLFIQAPSDGKTLGDGDVAHAVHMTTGGVHLGSFLDVVPTPFGDRLGIGAAPEPMKGPSGLKGAAFLLSATAVEAAGAQMPLAFDGPLIAITATLGDARITHVTESELLPGDAAPGREQLFADDRGRLFVISTGVTR